MKHLFNKISTKALSFSKKEEEGATMVEYAIMIALIAVVSIVIIGTLGQSVSGVFDTVNTSLAGVTPG